jgi:hypothetical protein
MSRGFNQALPIPRSELDAAKERLRIPELWHLLGCPGEPGRNCQAPYREDRKPSLSIYAGGLRWKDFATGEGGDAIDFLGKVVGVTNGEAVRQFLERANGVVQMAPQRKLMPKHRPQPDFRMLRAGRPWELARVAATRNIYLKAAEVAHDMGTLRFGLVCKRPSWIVTDSSGLCAEARRLDGRPYPALGTVFAERKAHTLRHSRKNWPVGILPAAAYRKSFDVIALVEGGPDFLAVNHFALEHHRLGILPVAILGRGVCNHGLHHDSLEHLSGTRVRIFPHDDPDGRSYENTALLSKQLERLDCEVDLFTFSGLFKQNGERIKDLNDCTEIAAEQSHKLKGLFP